jgi:uncharacterized protein YndB with AHSA1/START domain
MTTPSGAPVVVRVTHRFRASPERVFDAWLDPRLASRFLFTTPDSEVIRGDLDARVGGHWTIVDRRADMDAEHRGEYLEIDRPRRLVFSFEVPQFAEWTDRVEIDVAPLEGGGCELTLTHTMVPAAIEWSDKAVEGWTGILDGLASVLGE